MTLLATLLGLSIVTRGDVQETVPVATYIYEQDPTEGASETCVETLTKLLQAGGLQYQAIDIPKLWPEQFPHKEFPKPRYKADEVFPDIPSAYDLLQFSKKNDIKYLCIVRVQYHAESPWVALGPKTKGFATVDVNLIDVQNEELAIRERRIRTDSTRVEKGWETAASILVSSGVTVISGGPKTPHLKRAVQSAIAIAFERWLKDRVKSA